jgi:hypothetical protein
MQPRTETQLPEQLQYPWPPNLLDYEAKFFGVTATEGIALGFSLLVPIVISQNLGLPFALGLGIGLVVALGVFLSIRKMERLGGMSGGQYLLLRLRGLGRTEAIELPLILGGAGRGVELETWDGDTVTLLGEDA